MRGAQPFHSPRPRRISPPLCNGGPPAHGAGQPDGNAPKSLTCDSPSRGVAVDFARVLASQAKGPVKPKTPKRKYVKHNVWPLETRPYPGAEGDSKPI